MKQVGLHHPHLKTLIIAALIALSILLTAFDWVGLGHLRERLEGAGIIGMGLLITEVLFVCGAVLMAIGAGEDAKYLKGLPVWQWPKRVVTLRRRAKIFGRHLLTNRRFVTGFWLNFIGAVGTSIILITAVIHLAPYTGIGVVVLIIIDLIATLGWRIPVEIARRKARKHGN